MKTSTRKLVVVLLVALAGFIDQSVMAQSILNPNDTVVTYNPASPPALPTYGQIGKWVRTVDLGWNTTGYKCYFYKSNQFRLYYPPTYNPTANDGKKYPMLIFFHGVGEGSSSIYDNEEQLYHGGQIFADAVAAGTFNGYVLCMQTAGGWGSVNYQELKEIVDYMVTNNKLDPFHVVANGLSGGGSGTWSMFLTYPTYVSGLIPMSAADISYTQPSVTNVAKFTPIWLLNGGLDGSPAPATVAQVTAAFQAAGANYTNKVYTTLGHDTWDSTWLEPNFWPFLNAAYASNPWTLYGQTQFCPGAPINIRIGLAPGFDAYQWRMNGNVINGATTDSISVTQIGTYDARVERGGIWSDWSHTPVVISIKTPTVTPPISISGLMSDAIPAADGKTYVTLQVPDSNYTSYTWEKVGSNTVLGTQQTFQATSPGSYIVSVTQQYGCSSNFSPPFTVINASGPNPPSAASNLVANPLSFTRISLNWARNPSPTYTEKAFEIYRATASGGPYTYIGQVPTDTVKYTDSSLTPNTKYYYVVRAIDSTAAAPLSNQASATTQSDKTPPTAPGNLTVQGTTSSTVSLIWNSSTDNVSVQNYQIYVNGTKSYTTTDTTFLVTGLVPSQQNTIYVVAVDGSGNLSAHSNQVSAASVNNGLLYNYYTTPVGWSVLPNFSTLTPVMNGQMPNVSINNTTQTINFGYTWQGYITIPVAGTYTFATSSDDGSALWFNSVGPNGTPLVNNDGLHGTVTATGTVTLQPGVYPIYMEYFQNGGGYVMQVLWSCQQLFGNTNLIPIANQYFAAPYTPAGTAPARPTVVTAQAQAYNKVKVSWTDNSNNESGFEVYRSVGATGPLSIISTTGPNVVSFIDSTVQASTTYYYRVQAINQYGSSGFDSASIGGITYSYYQGTWNNVPNFSTLTPVLTGTLTNISLSPSPTTTDFAFKFQGFINIPTTGSYTFYTTSDDGSDLYIGGLDSAHLVVKNDFLQGATQRSGTISLTKGKYPFYVTYFQQGGAYVLTAAYKGPGIAQQNIPDSAFYNNQAAATTPALPAAPPVPGSLVATALSSSSIGLTWRDTASTVTGYQLYRSIGDSSHFILQGSPAASATSYSDTALFANQAYYYKLSATGVGGNSAYTAVVYATTKDVLPVVTNPGNLSVHYGTTTVVPVSATSVNTGTLSLAAYNLPAFASFTDNGNRTGSLTLSPAIGNQGNYTGLYIVATDAFGGTDTTKFNLSVNNYYAPTIDTIANYTINENDTLSIPLIAVDQNASDTLTLSATGLPGGSTVTAVSNGSATLFLHPSYAAAGTYNVQVTAKDNNGLSVTRSFVLTVNYKDPTVKIYTRVYTNDAIGAPWNSLTGPTATNLVDGSGNTTTVGLTLSPTYWWGAFNGGPTTGNNSGVYPDAVEQDYYYFGIFGGPDSVNGTLSGLDTSQLYNLTFYAGSVWTGVPNNGTTTYRSGNQGVSLNVQGNTQNTVTISSLKPAANGTIPFVMGIAPGSPAGFLNALVITKQYDDGTAPAGTGSLTATEAPGQVRLNWTDSAYNATGYEVWRSLAGAGNYTLLNTLAGGAVSYVDSNITGNTAYTYRVQAINAHGVSGYDSVNTTTLNRLPKINAIANVALTNAQQLTVNVTTVDDSTAHLTLTATNLPPFATFTDNGNGTGVLTISPAPGTIGVYPGVTVTVTDGLDSTASTSFVIAVTEPNVSSVYVNFSDGLNAAPAPWNTMSGPPLAGKVMTGLVDDSNNPTSISLSLVNGFQWFVASGMQPYNGHSVYPDVVLRTAYYDGTSNTDVVKVSGLSAAKKYNFVFFGSHDDGQSGMTNYTINGETVSLQATHNINKTVQINYISPDTSGSVTISVARGTGGIYSFLTSLVIQSYDSTVGMLNPADLRIIGIQRHALALQWQDRTYNETGFEVWRANDSSSANYTLIATVGAGVTSYKDSGLSQNKTYYYIVRAVNSNTGTYSGYSSPASGATYDYQVFVAFTPTNIAPVPWNNLNGGQPQLGATWNNFLDELSAQTSVGMQVTSNWSGLYSAGQDPGDNSGIYPDTVLINSYGLFPGVVGTLQVTGLDQSKVYDLTFLGSSQAYGDVNATYMVNGKYTILNAALNINGTATLYGLVPDANGNLNITISLSDPTSQFGLINTMVVQGYSLSTNTAGPPTLPAGAVTTPLTQMAQATNFVGAKTAAAAADSTGAQGFSAYPNPFTQSFTLSVPANNGDNIMVSIYDLGGHIVYEKEFDGLYGGTNYLPVNASQSMATKGVYIVKVVFAGTNKVDVVKVIKN